MPSGERKGIWSLGKDLLYPGIYLLPLTFALSPGRALGRLRALRYLREVVLVAVGLCYQAEATSSI